MEYNKELYIRKDPTALNLDLSLKHASVAEGKSSGNETIDIFRFDKRASAQQKKSFRKSARSHKNAFVLFLLFSFLFINCCLVEFTEGSPKHYCLRHCHMCRQMYGRHFMIHLCKDDCVESRGRDIPDCLDLRSIEPYLILTD